MCLTLPAAAACPLPQLLPALLHFPLYSVLPCGHKAGGIRTGARVLRGFCSGTGAGRQLQDAGRARH